MIDTLYQESTDRALDDLIKRPRPPGPPESPRLTFGGMAKAPFLGLAAGGAESLAFGSEVLGAFGQVAGSLGDSGGGMFATQTPEEKKQREAARAKVQEGLAFSNELGDTFRARAKELMPDPQTTHAAEQLTAGLFKFGGKAVGYTLATGPLAPFLLGGDEAMSEADRLRLQGVDLATRTKAGAVAGTVAGASIAVPVVGSTPLATAGLVGAVGPGGFMAQQAATKAILDHAGYDKIASQYDPFDPVGLAVSTLVPAAFGAAAHGIRAKSLADVVKTIESQGQRYGADGQLLTSPKGAQGEMQVMPATARDPGLGVAPARDASADELARVGRDYLAALEARYGSPDKAMAAYNAGPGAVDHAIAQHGEAWLAHLPQETQAYVSRGLREIGGEHLAAAVRDNPELVDAARVQQVRDQLDASRLTPEDDIAGHNEHQSAVEMAHEQMAAGDPVSVEITRPLRDLSKEPESAIVNDIDLGATREEKVRQLARLTEDNRPIVQAFLRDLDQALGTKSADNVKKPDAILSKAQRPEILATKPWHDVEHIRDSYRFKTVLDTFEQLPQVIERLNALGARIVKADVDKVLAPKKFGWRIAAFDLQMPNGQLVEYYLPMQELEHAKQNGGHQLFEEVRNLDPANPADRAKREEVAARSREHYQAAFDAYLKRTGQSEAAIRASLDRAMALSGASSSKPPASSAPNVMAGAGDFQAPEASRTAENLPGPNTNAAGPSEATNARVLSTPPILQNAAVGRESVAITERGGRIRVRWAVVEAPALVTSHTNDLHVNPAFPSELQPRDRSRAASEQQIASIENNIHPELLGDSPKASDGAPIVGGDGVVESGNARTIALRRAYDSGKADKYRAWLDANVERFGIDARQLEGMKEPMLVRVGEGSYDRAEFARQANASSVAAMSQTEQAKADAATLPDLESLKSNDDGTINVLGSAPFIRAFMQAVSPTERPALMTATGELSQQGVQRIRNAVFAKAYGDADLVSMMAESTDANVKNILTGMLRAAPEVARVRELMDAGARHEADITGPLVQAVRKFSQLRAEGMKVEQFLSQGSMFDSGVSPAVASMMQALEADSRAPKRVADMIRGLADSVDSLGDPRQGGMFEAPSAEDTVGQAAQRASLSARVADIRQSMPDLMVQLDGMDAPMLASEVLDAAQREAAHDNRDSALVQAAADCFLKAA